MITRAAFEGNYGYAKMVKMSSEFRRLPSVDRLLAEKRCSTEV